MTRSSSISHRVPPQSGHVSGTGSPKCAFIFATEVSSDGSCGSRYPLRAILFSPFFAGWCVRRSIAEAIADAGSTSSTSTEAIAARGMLSIMASSGFCTMATPPSFLITLSPYVPSLNAPDSTTPTTRGPNACAAVRNSGSIAGLNPFSRGPWVTHSRRGEEHVVVRPRDVNVAAHDWIAVAGQCHGHVRSASKDVRQDPAAFSPCVENDEDRRIDRGREKLNDGLECRQRAG